VQEFGVLPYIFPSYLYNILGRKQEQRGGGRRRGGGEKETPPPLLTRVRKKGDKEIRVKDREKGEKRGKKGLFCPKLQKAVFKKGHYLNWGKGGKGTRERVHTTSFTFHLLPCNNHYYKTEE